MYGKIKKGETMKKEKGYEPYEKEINNLILLIGVLIGVGIGNFVNMAIEIIRMI